MLISKYENGFEPNRIADSFAKFLDICKSDHVNPRSLRSPGEREAELVANGKSDNITEGLREMWRQEYEKYKNIIQEKVTLT